MKKRCYKQYATGYDNYGGRGIRVCDEWLASFESFYNWSMSNGYTEDLTIDRIDNDGHYEPSNCRWADYSTQNSNRGKLKNNTSGHSGIHWNEHANKWIARACVGGERKHLGCFDDIDDAVAARSSALVS
jgi:hypothetical protein